MFLRPHASGAVPIVALLLTMLVLSGFAGFPSVGHRSSSDARSDMNSTAGVKSLIVQYAPGRVPTDTVPLLGSSKVTGDVRQTLRLGPALGNDMWRVDFTKPVTRTVATRVARQLADHRFILFAEIDEKVGAFAT